MYGRKALFFDTSSIGNTADIESIVREQATSDIFTTESILKEIGQRIVDEEKKYRKRQKKAGNDTVRSHANPKLYKEISDAVIRYEEMFGKQHRAIVSNIVYDAQFMALSLHFKKKRKKLQRYIGEIQQFYQPVFQTFSTEMSIRRYEAYIISSSSGGDSKDYKISSIDDLDCFFSDSKARSARHENRLLKLEGFRDYIDKLSHAKEWFAEKGVAEDSRNDGLILMYGEMSPKNVARKIYVDVFKKRRLRTSDIEKFIRHAHEYYNNFLSSSAKDIDGGRLIGRAAEASFRYAISCIKNGKGKIPKNNIITDAKLVTAAFDMIKSSEEYRDAAIYTEDSDLVWMANIVNSYCLPKGKTLAACSRKHDNFISNVKAYEHEIGNGINFFSKMYLRKM